MSRRTERVGESVRAELARVLREEVTDPAIGLVTLTGVEVAPDLRSARVYWSVMGAGGDDDDEAEAERVAATARGLARAAGFLRRRLAAALPTRRVPELRFRHDPSLALGTRTLAILREIEHGAAR